MTRWLALLPLLAGCVVADGLSEVKLLPEGPILVNTYDNRVALFIETEATGSARLLVDGREDRTELPLNELFLFPLAPFGEGVHTLQARVYDGVHPLESNAVEVTFDYP